MPTKASFLNVDFDPWSTQPLEPLQEALGSEIFVLHSSKDTATLELSGDPDSVDEAISRMAAILACQSPSLASLQQMGLEVAITQGLSLSDGQVFAPGGQERRALVPPFADIHRAFWGHGRIFFMATDDKADGGYLLRAE